MSKSKARKAEKVEEPEQALLGANPNNEKIFAVCHLLATFNDTFIHITDLSGRETLARVTGGMMVKADREESSPYAAMLAAVEVCNRLKKLGINSLHIKI